MFYGSVGGWGEEGGCKAVGQLFYYQLVQIRAGKGGAGGGGVVTKKVN